MFHLLHKINPQPLTSGSPLSTELRIGVNGTKPLTERTKLVGTLEGVHRFEKTSSNVSGEVLGVGGFTFDFPGQSYDQDWLRVGLGAETKIGGGVASLMLNATTVGEIPNAWLAVRYQATFYGVSHDLILGP